MSGREVESALHLGLVFQQIPVPPLVKSSFDVTAFYCTHQRMRNEVPVKVIGEMSKETSSVPATSGETSRKRTADVEPTADVPSASRRRRSANTDASSYIRPTFPSCCVNGVVEQTCLMPSSPGYDPTTAAAVRPPTAPIHGPQVIAPQVHAQLAALPSTSLVHNMTPVTVHLHGPPSVNSNYAYFLPHPMIFIQPMMSLRLPAVPPQYLSPQDIPFGEHPYTPALMNGEISEDYLGRRRSLDELPMIAATVPVAVAGNWDRNALQYNPYPGFTYLPRSINAQMESVVSRVRIAQAAAQVGVDPAAATQMLAGTGRTRHPVAVEYYGDGRRNSPLVEGPVAVPTMTAEWMPQQAALQTSIETVSAANYHQQLERMANGEIPFRAWEAAVLHIFDRMAPQMNSSRLPPKGMTKNEIDQLKSFRVTDPALLMEKVCVICQCDFEKRDLVRMLPCAHHFHLRCIDKWLKGNRTCPICRQNATSDEDDTLEGASLRGGGRGTAATATVMTGTSRMSGGVRTENVTRDENGDFENPRAAVQVITQTRGTSEPLDGSYHDSRV
uniref:RING-type domain-containing protein n=1 Tax=Elaeophora elaphi TaxID=1147741 RepID=A0A0R3RJA7_9BILA